MLLLRPRFLPRVVAQPLSVASPRAPGTSAKRHHAWPRQLSSRCGRVLPHYFPLLPPPSSAAGPASVCSMATSADAADGSAEVSECRGLRLAAQGEALRQHTLTGLQACGIPDDRARDVGEGGTLADGESRFELARCVSGLQTGTTLGQVLLAAGVLPSTHSFLQLNGHLLPDGVVLVADKQAGGKGRGGNAWVSLTGCLMFSACKLMAVSGQQLPFLQYVVALSVVQAVHLLCAKVPQAKSFDLKVKWPNDLYIGPLKVGGVLCNSSYRDGKFLVVIGVGLNVSNREPTTCINAALGCTSPVDDPVTSEELLSEILNRLDANLVTFARDGFLPMKASYLANWLHSGQQVMLEEGEDTSGVRQIPLTIQGLTNSGYLLATDAYGTEFELHPDGNSLDFFKGLVRKKLY